MIITDTAELAAQVVFDYPDWSDAHINDIMAAYDECGDVPPCNGDQLYAACNKLQSFKAEGNDYSSSINLTAKWLKEVAHKSNWF